MLRRLALCLGLLLSLVILLPFATSTAHNLRTQSAVRSHRFRHHSRAWWRRHRAMLDPVFAVMKSLACAAIQAPLGAIVFGAGAVDRDAPQAVKRVAVDRCGDFAVGERRADSNPHALPFAGLPVELPRVLKSTVLA